MRYFPYIATAIGFGIGACAGVLGRYALGRRYHVLVAMTLVGLIPWLDYNLMIFRLARAAEVPAAAVLDLKLLSFAGMNCLLIVTLVAARRFPPAASLVPAESFLLTWCAIVPRAMAASPSGHLNSDNVATVWFFIVSACMTGVLFSYWSVKPRAPWAFESPK